MQSGQIDVYSQEIHPDKTFFFKTKVLMFSLFSHGNTQVPQVGASNDYTQVMFFKEKYPVGVLMRTHRLCFPG